MNWFERHLNLTWLIVLVPGYLLGIILATFVATLFINTTPPEKVIDAILYIAPLIVIIPVTIWVLRSKGRSLWWLLLTGLFVPMVLSNKKTLVDEVPKCHILNGKQKDM